MNKRKTVLTVIAVAVVLVGILYAVGLFNDSDENKENEIRVQIQLDLKEDIGLFLINSEFAGHEEGGGVSNADKSLIGKDELLGWAIDRQHYENISDTVDLTMRFSIVTEYYEPNYDNIYPEEAVIQAGEVSFPASFGEAYKVRITGDRENGYKAVIE